MLWKKWMAVCGHFFRLIELKYGLSEVNRLKAFERCSLNINEVKLHSLFISFNAIDKTAQTMSRVVS